MFYFSNSVSSAFKSLTEARLLLRTAVGLLGLFMPAFLYTAFNFSFEAVVCYYLVGHLLYALILPWSCRLLNPLGFRRAMRLAIVFGAMHYASFFFADAAFRASGAVTMDAYASPLWWWVVLSIVFTTFYRLLYWVPLHTEMAKFTDNEGRGRELSFLEAGTLAVGALMPLISGVVIDRYGYASLFIAAMFLYLASIWPLRNLPRVGEKYCWTYRQAWRELCAPERRRFMLAYVAAGVGDAFEIFVWPLYVWMLLKGDFINVGLLASLVVVATVLIQLAAGKVIDTRDKSGMMRWGNFLHALGWLFKTAIITPWQVFLVGTYHGLTRIISRTPFDALWYDKASQKNDLVDEYSVLHEMAFQIGQALACVAALLIFWSFDLKWSFVIAALASVAMNLLAKRKDK